MNSEKFAAIATLLSLVVAPAAAVTVTNCSNAHSGPGVTLSGAVAQGGRVEIGCVGRIIVSQAVVVPATRVTVVGRPGLVLEQTSRAGVFTGSPGSELTLSGLHLETSGNFHASSSVGPTITNVGRLTLMNFRGQRLKATTKDVRELKVIDSTFGSSGWYDRAEGDIPVLAAADITVSTTTFVNSQGPIVRLAKNAAGRFTQVSVEGGRAGLVCEDSAKSLTVATSTFTGVVAGDRVGGAVRAACQLEISGSTFKQNTAERGGAVHIDTTNAKSRISGSRFDGNKARESGGAISVASGAGAVVTLSRLRLDGNEAGRGGAIAAFGGVVQGTAINALRNQARLSGGALAIAGDATLMLGRVVLMSNTAPRGSALEVASSANSAVANALIVRNSGPDVVVGDRLELISSTIADNSQAIGIVSAGSITLRNTLLARNGRNCSGLRIVAADRHNLQFPDSTCSDVPVADPVLDSYFVPDISGPAAGAGDLSTCATSPVNAVDVYGQRRPRGASCSIGAVEGAINQSARRHDPDAKNRRIPR